MSEKTQKAIAKREAAKRKAARTKVAVHVDMTAADVKVDEPKRRS